MPGLASRSGTRGLLAGWRPERRGAAAFAAPCLPRRRPWPPTGEAHRLQRARHGPGARGARPHLPDRRRRRAQDGRLPAVAHLRGGPPARWSSSCMAVPSRRTWGPRTGASTGLRRAGGGLGLRGRHVQPPLFTRRSSAARPKTWPRRRVRPGPGRGSTPIRSARRCGPFRGAAALLAACGSRRRRGGAGVLLRDPRSARLGTPRASRWRTNSRAVPPAEAVESGTGPFPPVLIARAGKDAPTSTRRGDVRARGLGEGRHPRRAEPSDRPARLRHPGRRRAQPRGDPPDAGVPQERLEP